MDENEFIEREAISRKELLDNLRDYFDLLERMSAESNGERWHPLEYLAASGYRSYLEQ